MTPERWHQIDRLFGRAVELGESEREPYLKTSCGNDGELYAEVMALLASDDDAGISLRAVVEVARRGLSIGSSMPDRLCDRFQLRRELGTGGMGVVYEAFDEVRGELVALKMLPHVGARQIADMKREFRALADVTHPNLVRLHELFCDGDRWFFTMERVDGVPFVDAVRRDETTLRVALRGLCEGVFAIHEGGKLHRDLKPPNVLVGPGGRVTILDFGLARKAIRDAQSSFDLGAAGTPAYMAPEQLREDGACAASDWYAVGGMLFEALAGKRPYAATDIGELIAAKQRGAPPGLREALATAPPDLADLAIALLAHEAQARPTGAAVLAVLGELRPPPAAEPEPISEALFVGRERKLRALDEAFAVVGDFARGSRL